METLTWLPSFPGSPSYPGSPDGPAGPGFPAGPGSPGSPCDAAEAEMSTMVVRARL